MAGIKRVCLLSHYKKTLLKHVTVPRLSRSLHCSISPSSMAPSSSPLLASETDEKYANVKWEELGFALTPTDYMYVAKGRQGESFSQGKIVPYGDISISPCSPILNYGQGLFEGLKAYRTEDDRIMLFRPDQNALRMQNGAERLCMTPPSLEHFVEAVKQTVLANKKWVPPPGKGTMYIRPLLIGSGAILGVAPAPEYSFLIYVSPVGNYHKGSSGLNLKVDHKHHRAHPGGTGGVKSCTNYSPIVKSLVEAKSSGFSDVLFLDAATGSNIEEVSACNIFIVKGNIVSTPPTSGTILPGVTRKSISELARDIGYQVEERDVSVDELLEAEEVFCTGTAVVVKAVETVTFHDKKVNYRTGEAALSTKLHSMLTNIQMGVVEDKKGWMVEIDGCQG
ncbi:Branched-chain-amino-acid aminotransferase 6 [Cardamine amara subsp. amara]|uniref:Branched-chain-amino-acid aminotransferase n=1 Tax=Cardamine amara subsp. amara TaxID=228776 RepID=A0ABD0ZDE0_CARAN